jgi:predicted transcriptional regulator of viral defense system
MRSPDAHPLQRLSGLESPFRAKEAEALGVPRWRLRQLVKDDLLTELGRGLYQLATAAPSAEVDFIAVNKLAPKGIVCLNSSLSYWDLTDEIPRYVHIAVPRHSHRPQISYPPTKVHEFDPDTFELERRDIETPAGDFAIYGPERSVVDAFRLERLVGRDQGLAAMRRYMQRRDRDPNKLLHLATDLRARHAVQRSLELLLS